MSQLRHGGQESPRAVHGHLRSSHLLVSTKATYSFSEKLATYQVRLEAALPKILGQKPKQEPTFHPILPSCTSGAALTNT